jgi:hypothetical protein
VTYVDVNGVHTNQLVLDFVGAGGPAVTMMPLRRT